MKKCYYFPTFKEVKSVISLDESFILPLYLLKTLGQQEIKISLKNPRIDKGQELENIINNAVGRDLEDTKINQRTSSDPILAKLCELTGAKMYGDCVVLDVINNVCLDFTNDTVITGDLLWFDFITGKINDNYVLATQEVNYEFYSHCLDINIFEEYSKFLRKEENRWEEMFKFKILIDN